MRQKERCHCLSPDSMAGKLLGRIIPPLAFPPPAAGFGFFEVKEPRCDATAGSPVSLPESLLVGMKVELTGLSRGVLSSLTLALPLPSIHAALSIRD